MTETVPELLDQLNSMDILVRARAKAKLSALGQSAVEPLIAAMHTDRNPLCWEAASVLAELRDERSFAPMAQALRSSNVLLAQIAVKAIEGFGERGVPALLMALLDPDIKPSVKLSVVSALERLADQRAVPTLMALLEQTPETTLRYTIIQALGRLGDQQAVSLIQRYQDAPDHHTRRRAHDALRRLSETTVERGEN